MLACSRHDSDTQGRVFKGWDGAQVCSRLQIAVALDHRLALLSLAPNLRKRKTDRAQRHQ